ncbi:hypothetical protein QFC22_000195 [Naganishia vaughanmartiniae]|uniref:Uncharacterized protein n=1 Tax=Naganishia vaughanmartiniae TaxID=1424756 RepID=A0ACC2XNP4_9TREE|nr:hypothetical protein QFC22_000195 [Naganishia vaughanmartiniae]
MRFTTLATVSALVGAAGASAQVASPMDLLNYLSALLSPSCKATLQGVVASNSSVSQCINIPGLYPILMSNNGSIIPQVNTYLQSTCGLPACTDALITNTTDQVLSSCSTDLSNFGISNNTVRIVMNAYPTARKIACLSTNSTTLSNSTTVGYNATSNSTLCPVTVLDNVQAYLGVPLSTRYITSLVLGGNSTAYNAVTAVVNNRTIAAKLACNDCVQAAVDIVLEDYPTLENQSISVGNSSSWLSGNGTSTTLPKIYQGLCGVPVGANASLPKSINETAYNTTLGTSSSKNSTSSSITGATSTAKASATGIASILPFSSVASAASTATGVAARSAQEAKKRFVRWD